MMETLRYTSMRQRRTPLFTVGRRLFSHNLSDNAQLDTGNIPNLTKDHIEEAIKLAPTLSPINAERWHEAHKTFANYGVSINNFIKIVIGNPSILTRPPKYIQDSLNLWTSCQFGEKSVCQLLLKHPELLDILLNKENHKILPRKISFLEEFVWTKKNVWRLLMNSPFILNDDCRTIESKFDYLMKTMRCDIPDICKSEVLRKDLEEIKCRHVFLQRLAIFKVRPLKVSAHEDNKNPRLYQIMDTNEKEFSTKVAGVTLLEFETFKEYFKRELENAEDDVEDENEIAVEE